MYWNSGGLIATYKDVSVDPIDAAERDYTEYLAPPTTVYPGSDLRSGLLSAHQLVGDAVEWRLDALRSRLDQAYAYDVHGINYLSPVTTTSLVSPGIQPALPPYLTPSTRGTCARHKLNNQQHKNERN